MASSSQNITIAVQDLRTTMVVRGVPLVTSRCSHCLVLVWSLLSVLVGPCLCVCVCVCLFGVGVCLFLSSLSLALSLSLSFLLVSCLSSLSLGSGKFIT